MLLASYAGWGLHTPDWHYLSIEVLTGHKPETSGKDCHLIQSFDAH